MPDYSVKILVDVQGKKVMDELAKGGEKTDQKLPEGPEKTGAGKKTVPKSLFGAIGTAKEGVMKGEGIGSVFATLMKSITAMTAILGVGIGVLLMAVGNSKILSTIFGTIGKLLGFLLDIILLPLMPIFIMLVRWLYGLIMEFRKFTKNLSLKSLLDFGVNLLLLTTPFGWVIKLLQWALGEGNIQSAVDFTLAILKGVGGWLWGIAEYLWGVNASLANTLANLTLGILKGAGDWLWNVAGWLWGVNASIVNTVTQFTIDILQGAGGWLWSVASWVWGVNMNLANTVFDISMNIGSAIAGVLAGIADLAISILKFIWGVGPGPQLTQITIDFLANPIGWIWSFLKSLWEGGKGIYNMAAGSLGLPLLDKGGEVMKTGIAVVHRREIFSGVTGGGQPAARVGGGGDTYIFQNYGNTKTEYELFLRFMDFVRQRGMGLKL